MWLWQAITIIAMQTRENYKRGKGGREKSRLPGTSTSEFFFGSHPKKEPKKCFPDYRMWHRKIRKGVAFLNKYISLRQRWLEWMYFLLLIQALWWLSYWALSFLEVISERFSIVKGMIPGFLRVAYIRCLYYWPAFILLWPEPCFIRSPYLFMSWYPVFNMGCI